MTIIKGRVIKIHRLGAKLTFLHLSCDGDINEIVLEDISHQIKRGDFIIAKGTWCPHQKKKAENEFIITEILNVIPNQCTNNTPIFLSKSLSPSKISSLNLRTVVETCILEFYQKLGFTLVNSPILVGNWVKGQTGNFPLNFYNDEHCSLRISTMLHHQIIMSHGYNNIFEIAKLFRQENPSHKNRLAEFTNIVVGMTDSYLDDIISIFSKMIIFLHKELKKRNFEGISIPNTINFQQISFTELLEKAKLNKITGHQLPEKIRNFLNKEFNSFVWVTNFPSNTRPFYVKSNGDFCFDCQLWYRGTKYIAAGGETETNPDILKRKIEIEGKLEDDFKFLLDTLNFGLPPLSGIDLGIERFLSVWLDRKESDFSFFPRYKNHFSP